MPVSKKKVLFAEQFLAYESYIYIVYKNFDWLRFLILFYCL